MLSAFLTWASLFLAVISVGLAVYFYLRQKYDGSEAAGKAEQLGLELDKRPDGTHETAGDQRTNRAAAGSGPCAAGPAISP